MSYVHIAGHRLVLPFYFSTAMTFTGVLNMGTLLKPYLLKQSSNWSMWVACLVIIVMAYILPLHQIDCIWNRYEDLWPIMLVESALQCAALITLCRLLPKFLAIFGRYSLLLLLIHFYFIDIFSHFGINGILLYVSVVIATVTAAHLCNLYIPHLSGFKYLIPLETINKKQNPC